MSRFTQLRDEEFAMALKPCRECGKEVSTEAAACPHCGIARPATMPEVAPPKDRPRGTVPVFAALFGLVVIAGIVEVNREPTHTRGIGPVQDSLTTVQGVHPSATIPFTAVGDSGASQDGWSGYADTSKMDGSIGYVLTLGAENDIKAWLDTPRPDLVIRCKEHETNAYVVTNTAATPELGNYNEYSVRLRYDDGPPLPESWSQSTDSKALFAPSPVRLAQRLGRAKRFRFQFTPFNESPAVAEFDVRGLSKHLGDIARACGWKAK